MSRLYNSHSPKVMRALAPSDTDLVVTMSLTSQNKLPASNMSWRLDSARMEASRMAIMK